MTSQNMQGMRRYRRKAGQTVVAVQLRLETEGFTYRKWGGIQQCKQGDWLVDSGRDVYTVDADSFAKTYTVVQKGIYIKSTPVWAKEADSDGHVETKEGRTAYVKGDLIVFNSPDGSDIYAVKRMKFFHLYELDE